MMVFQSRAVSEILLGHDAGWQVQRRDDGAVPRAEVARKLIPPTLVGFAMAAAAYSISLPLLYWMSPVLLGLLLSIPVGLLTSRRWRSPGVLATPEDRAPPPVVARAAKLAGARASRPPARSPGCAKMRTSPPTISPICRRCGRARAAGLTSRLPRRAPSSTFARASPRRKAGWTSRKPAHCSATAICSRATLALR